MVAPPAFREREEVCMENQGGRERLVPVEVVDWAEGIADFLGFLGLFTLITALVVLFGA